MKEKKGLFKSIGSGLNNLLENTVSKVNGKPEKDRKYIKRTRKTLVGVDYRFEKVPDTNGKFLEIQPIGNQLIGISNSGIYELSKEGAKRIISEKISKAIVLGSDEIIISTKNFETKIYTRYEEVWAERIAVTIDDIIVNMWAEDNGTIWLTGSSRVYKAQLSDENFTLLEDYAIANQYLDPVEIARIAGKIYFVNTQGYFYLDQPNNQILPDQSLQNKIGTPLKYLKDRSTGLLWIYNGKLWQQIGREGEIRPYDYLNFFPDLVGISSDEETNALWLLTEDQGIYNYNPTTNQGFESTHPLFARKISRTFQDKDFTLSYEENSLSVDLSKPDFQGLLQTEFQYRLVGLNPKWSSWSKNRTIDFSYLPAGKYQLEVRSKDAFGNEEEEALLEFKVKPPYWANAMVLCFGNFVVWITGRFFQSHEPVQLDQ